MSNNFIGDYRIRSGKLEVWNGKGYQPFKVNKMNIENLDLSSLSTDQLIELEEKIQRRKKEVVPKGYRVSFVVEYKEEGVPEYPYGTHPLENQGAFYDFIEDYLSDMLRDIAYKETLEPLALTVEEVTADELRCIHEHF